MKKILIIVILAVCLGLIFTDNIFAKMEWKSEWPKQIRIGSASIGGGFYMGASALSNVILKEFSGVEVVVEQTKASVHNTMLMEQNQIEFGMNVTDVAWQALHGVGNFDKEYNKFRIVTLSWPGMKTFYALKNTKINSITDLNGKRVSVGTAGGAIDIFVRTLFDELAIKADIVNMTTTDGRNALENGLIDALCIGHPAPSMQELSIIKDIKLIGISGSEIEEYRKNHPENTYDMVIPAGYYNKVDEDVLTVGCYNLIMARFDLPEDLVYAVTKALYENIDLVYATYPDFATQLKSPSIEGINTPLHDGAIKYYKEIGLDIPEELIY